MFYTRFLDIIKIIGFVIHYRHVKKTDVNQREDEKGNTPGGGALNFFW